MPLLSPRLLIIAEEIAKIGYQDIVYDICADHAYLPIYLIKNGICGTVAAADISPRSLERARRNAESCGVPATSAACGGAYVPNGSGGILLCEGDGFSSIPGAAYTPGKIAVIAGIGGDSIINIAQNGIERARAASLLIFQPMSRQEDLREWLLKNSFEICYERLAPEGDRIYSLLFCRHADIAQPYEPEEIYAGCRVKYATNDEYIQFLCFTRRKIINRFNGLKSVCENREIYINEIKRLEATLDYIDARAKTVHG